MSSYRRGLIFARRYEGLSQYRLWAQQQFDPALVASGEEGIGPMSSGRKSTSYDANLQSGFVASASAACALDALVAMQRDHGGPSSESTNGAINVPRGPVLESPSRLPRGSSTQIKLTVAASVQEAVTGTSSREIHAGEIDW